jgi:hypothetical protein
LGVRIAARPRANQTSQTTGTERRDTQSNRTNTAQRGTMTGCLMQESSARNAPWMLSHATPASSGESATTRTSRSGSPSNEGSTTGNRETTGAGVSGSTSTGTSGARTRTDGETEAEGAATTGATDQRGITVGAGAAAGATETPRAARTRRARPRAERHIDSRASRILLSTRTSVLR